MEAQRIELAVVRQSMGDGVRVTARVLAGDGKTYFQHSRDIYYENDEAKREQWCRIAEQKSASECIQDFVYWVQQGCPSQAEPTPT